MFHGRNAGGQLVVEFGNDFCDRHILLALKRLDGGAPELAVNAVVCAGLEGHQVASARLAASASGA